MMVDCDVIKVQCFWSAVVTADAINNMLEAYFKRTYQKGDTRVKAPSYSIEDFKCSFWIIETLWNSTF